MRSNRNDNIGLRQTCSKNQHISSTKDNKKRQSEIVSALKELTGVSLSNLFFTQCRKKSDEDGLVLLRTSGKNLCVIAIYVKGSNIRLEINCNSVDMKYFKRSQLKKIRKDFNLGNGKG